MSNPLYTMLSLIRSIIYHCNSFQRKTRWDPCGWHPALCRRFQSKALLAFLSAGLLTLLASFPMGTLYPALTANFKVPIAWDPGKSPTRSF